MRLYLTRDEEGLCLWRAKPFLGSDNFWYEEEDGFDNITEEIYHSLTAEQIKTGRIKNRRHK